MADVRLAHRRAVVCSVLLSLVGVACQGANLEDSSRGLAAPAGKPNVLLLIDKSASMNLPIDPQAASCLLPDAGTCGKSALEPCDTVQCPTRWIAVQQATGLFLEEENTQRLRTALALFPQNGSAQACGEATLLTVGFPPSGAESDVDMALHNNDVRASLFAISQSGVGAAQVSGATPTAASLRFVSSLAPLNDPTRANFAVLITDGLPNCNDAFSPPYPDSGCVCTVSTCASAPADRIGCLDEANTISQLLALRAAGIRTAIIGVGEEVKTPQVNKTLRAMAEAGGLARACPNGTHSECGATETCEASTHLCTRRHYTALTMAELKANLDTLAGLFVSTGPQPVQTDGGHSSSSDGGTPTPPRSPASPFGWSLGCGVTSSAAAPVLLIAALSFFRRRGRSRSKRSS
jgi:hypothetical protein